MAHFQEILFHFIQVTMENQIPVVRQDGQVSGVRQAGMVEVPVLNYVDLTESQKVEFMQQQIKELALQLSQRKAQDELLFKQQQIAREELRKNEIRIEKEKLKKNPNNVRFMETLLKLTYQIEDCIDAWKKVVLDPLAVKDGAEASETFAGKEDTSGQAFFINMSCFKEMKKIISIQKTHSGCSQLALWLACDKTYGG